MITELCELGFKYRTDKCPQILHTYTPVYYELFNPIRNSVKKVLEFGIGNLRFRDKISSNIIGGSLRMWRDFFPNAKIYGADYDPATMLVEERIETFVCNERDTEQVKKLIETVGSDIDIFIDDASHRTGDQIALCNLLMPMLKKDVIYVIEDVTVEGNLLSYLKNYDVEVPKVQRLDKFRDKRNHIIIVRHKK